MPTFVFRADLACRLTDGTRDTLRGFKVVVEADNAAIARDHVAMVATELVHDRGGRLLDAPLDRLDVIQCDLVQSR